MGTRGTDTHTSKQVNKSDGVVEDRSGRARQGQCQNWRVAEQPRAGAVNHQNTEEPSTEELLYLGNGRADTLTDKQTHTNRQEAKESMGKARAVESMERRSDHAVDMPSAGQIKRQSKRSQSARVTNKHYRHCNRVLGRQTIEEAKFEQC